jgi:hypothetical protein
MAIPFTAREPLEFTPPSLPERLQGQVEGDPTKHKVRILIRVPTMVERDSYASALIRAGVISYTRQQIRDLAMAGVQTLCDPSKHEEQEALLREFWAVTDEEKDVQIRQGAKLQELYEKATAAGTEPPAPADITKELAEITPSVTMDAQRRIRALAFNQELMATYPPLREALSALTDQDAKRSWLNAQVYITGFVGLEHQPDGNGRGGLLQHEAEYLRGEVGQEAFEEISDFITALQGIDEEEEKNLGSLLVSMSAPIGSNPSDSSANSDPGSSTAGPSTKTPASASPKTTASSSRSTKSSRTKRARSSALTRTAGPSSTSPSS